MDSYKPYNNTLTPVEQERLKKMYDAAEGEDKKILERVLRKYGARAGGHVPLGQSTRPLLARGQIWRGVYGGREKRN